MHTFDKSSLKNLLNQLLDERLKRLEKRNESQLSDLNLEKISFKKQGEIINKLKLINIKPKKSLFSITTNNSVKKKKKFHQKIINKTPEIIHNPQKVKNRTTKKKTDVTPSKTLKKNKTTNVLLPHYLSSTRATILKNK